MTIFGAILFASVFLTGCGDSGSSSVSEDAPAVEVAPAVEDAPAATAAPAPAVEETPVAEEALKVGEQYYFEGSNGDLECPECDPCWCIKFKDETNAELWSKPCGGSTVLKSCSSDVSYKFDKTTNTVTILSIVNNNVSSECKNRFIGEWLWSEGQFGKRFYSKNNPGCDFH